LAFSDVQLTESPEAVKNLFAKLGYPTEDGPPVDVPLDGLPPSLQRLVQRAYVIASVGDDLRVVLVELGDLHAATLRGLAGNLLHRGYQPLIAAVDPGYRTLTVATPLQVTPTRQKLLKLVIDRAHPTRQDLDVLEGLSAVRTEPRDIVGKVKGAFDVDAVTNRFFKA
jgi:hypothetical protein